MLAEVAARLRRYADSEALLERCLSLAPGFEAARHHYAIVLYRQQKIAQALGEVLTGTSRLRQGSCLQSEILWIKEGLTPHDRLAPRS